MYFFVLFLTLQLLFLFTFHFFSMATLPFCRRWNGRFFSILLLWCLCVWSTQIVHGQGNGAGAVDDPTLASPPPPGANPATPGSPGEIPPPPPPDDPSAPLPPFGGGGGGLIQPVGPPTAVTTGLVLPTVIFIPPASSGVDMNTTTPFFPAKSVSCQQCRYFYPKLVECNMIANQTLGLIPRLGEPRTSSSIVTGGPGAMPLSKNRAPLLTRGDREEDEEEYGWDGGPGMESIMKLISKFGLAGNPGSPTSTLANPTGNGDGNLGPGGVSTSSPSGTGKDTGKDQGHIVSSSDQHDLGGTGVVGTPTSQSMIDFTSIMPFLQCICPNQGLAAAKVCLTCFRVTNQRNFLDGLSQQNVTTSLSAFAEACADSRDGTRIPPSGTRGQSASGATNGVGQRGAELKVAASLAGVLGVLAVL